MTSLAPRFDPILGTTQLSRRHLARLVELSGGTVKTVGSAGSADGRASPDHRIIDVELHGLGALVAGRPHPDLAPHLAVVARCRSRFWLRQWRVDGRRVIEGLIGPAGVLLLPDGSDPDAVQDVRRHPRAGSVARLLAVLLGLRPAPLPTALPVGPVSWADLKALAAGEPCGWADEPDSAATLYDLIWQPTPDGPRGSVVVLIRFGDGSLAEACAVDPDDPTCSYRLVPRSPAEVWVGLCRLLMAEALLAHPIG